MGYSDNREQIKELKYLRKVLGEVDENIPVPDSVRGASLRHLLDDVTPQAPPAPNRRGGVTFGFDWFNLRTAATYAAAFALMMGLFYGLSFQARPDMVEGVIVPRSSVAESAELPEDDAMESPLFAMGLDLDEAAPEIQIFSMEDEAQPGAAPTDTGAVEDRGGRSHSPAVGGSGTANVLGSQNGYTYTWRKNEGSDPDKGTFPVTIDIVSDTAAEVVYQLDILDMEQIQTAYFTSSALVVVGVDDDEVVIHSYDISDPAEASQTVKLTQPGSYAGSREGDGFVYVATYADSVDGVSGEVQELSGAVNASACVISAVDTASGGTNQLALQGADNQISVYPNSNIFLSYDMEVSPDTVQRATAAMDAADVDVPPEPEEEQDTVADVAADETGAPSGKISVRLEIELDGLHIGVKE